MTSGHAVVQWTIHDFEVLDLVIPCMAKQLVVVSLELVHERWRRQHSMSIAVPQQARAYHHGGGTGYDSVRGTRLHHEDGVDVRCAKL